jgi:S-adenosylmethionine synthetase
MRPNYIIHCAAERRPDVSEKDPAATLRLNVEATRTLATVAAEIGSWFLYISTDYVFDGSNPPYFPQVCHH